MVLTPPMVFAQTDGIVSVLLDHTHMRGPSFARMSLLLKKTLDLDILGFYQLASVTEAFFSDRNFCWWSDYIFFDSNFFCSLMETRTETSFCDANFFCRKFFSGINFSDFAQKFEIYTCKLENSGFFFHF